MNKISVSDWSEIEILNSEWSPSIKRLLLIDQHAKIYSNKGIEQGY